MILIVSYDLKGRRDYVPLFEALKQQGPWWHYLASTWLLSTWKNPQDVAAALRPYMDENDSLLVADMGARYQGFLPLPAWEWIQNQLNPFMTPPLGTVQPQRGIQSGLDALKDRVGRK